MAIRQTGSTQNAAQGSRIDEIRVKAEAGEVKAQYHLGLMFYGGHFLEQDYIEAFKWFTLAADQGDQAAFLHREALGPLLTSRQMDQAKKRVEDFVPKKNPPKN